MGKTWTDWGENITATEVREQMQKRKTIIACNYKDGERRQVIWYPGLRSLKVDVNGIKKEFPDDNKGLARALVFFKKDLPT